MRITFGDGAYDRGPVYQKLYEHGIQAIILMKQDGRLQDDPIREVTGLGKGDETRKL